MVRLGLVQIISADTPVTGVSVPETLLLDLERLFRLQNEFGRIVVLAACLLILRQMPRSSKGEAQPGARPTYAVTRFNWPLSRLFTLILSVVIVLL